jgi:HD-like signal output (HDOD) protein
MLNRDNYSGAQMARVIETDPAIAQALLSHANAEWYEEDGAPPLSSLLLASRRIGARGVHAAVMSVVLEGGCIQPGAGFNQIARMVWDHMVRVAPLSRLLAHGFGGDPDSGFTLGLCHDVGKLLLFERIADLRKTERRNLAFPRGFLRAALKLLHEPLGGLTSFAWNMPPEYAAAIASHHRTKSRSERNPLSEAVFVAEQLDLMTSGRRELDLEQLWRDGGISIPLETGARLFEQARQTAVVGLIEERRARGELPPS